MHCEATFAVEETSKAQLYPASKANLGSKASQHLQEQEADENSTYANNCSGWCTHFSYVGLSPGAKAVELSGVAGFKSSHEEERTELAHLPASLAQSDSGLGQPGLLLPFL